MNIVVLILFIVAGLLLLWGFIEFAIREVLKEIDSISDPELLDDDLPYRMIDHSTAVHCEHFKESQSMLKAP